MSRARLVITAITKQGLAQVEAARTYGLSEATVSRLMARFREEGEAAFEPRSRRPRTSPGATPPETVELVLQLRKQLLEHGHDAGADTLGWHLAQHHTISLSRATIHRILTRHGAVTPEPKKRPKSSYIRFQAAMPNDDCTRYALHVSAHRAITTPIVKTTFRETAAQHGIPASTLTDNGMVYTVRLAGIGRQGGRNGFEQQLHDWHVVQMNSRPNHPTTCGKAERFQHTMKNWLRAQPDQPATIAELQALLDRIRHDIIDKSGTVTLRIAGQLRHIGIGRTHTRTHVILLVQDLEVRVINAITGELLRELTIDTSKDYQPQK